MKHILLGISGSIATYKAADLASKLTQAGHQVTAVMTRSALQFITPMTLQTLTRQPVVTDLFDEKESWRPTHIQLADSADLLLVAPASANTLARLAQGMADDALTAIALATRAPVLLAPAMNGKMWAHPATQRNLATLLGWGHQVIGPAARGMLACGYEGAGRLSPVEEIFDFAERILAGKDPDPGP